MNTTYGQEWKTYPYSPEGGIFTFPGDEGHHPEDSVEWWYITGHLQGMETGTRYSFMLTYFYFPYAGFDGFRILNLADEDGGTFFDDMEIVNYQELATDRLLIDAFLVFENRNEFWKTSTNSEGQLIPFEYEISARSNAGSIDLEVTSLRPPIYVGDSGYFKQGADSYTSYYSQTRNTVTGTIVFGDNTEEISGTAWIDRQFGMFNTLSAERYEWFSVQLSNGMELNIWNLFTGDNQLPDSPAFKHITIVKEDATHLTTKDFNLERLSYHYMPDSAMCYSQSWRLLVPGFGIDLIIATQHDNCEVQRPFRFYEGTTTVSGIVNGLTVSGQGFAELVKGYEPPEIYIYPVENSIWEPTTPIHWEPINPDVGRPLMYTLEYSIDTLQGFYPAISGISDTFCIWNDTPLPDGQQVWFRIQGYTVDTTLSGYSNITDAVVQKTGSSIDEHSLEHPFMVIYPNPADNFVTIRFKEEISYFAYRILDISGKQIVESGRNSADKTAEIDVQSLESGIYILKISTGVRDYSTRIQVVE